MTIKSKIPRSILEEFLDFLQRENTVTKEQYTVIPETNTELLTSKTVERRSMDLKATITLFEKMYPDYFAPEMLARIEKLKASSGANSEEDTIKAIRDVFAV